MDVFGVYECDVGVCGLFLYIGDEVVDCGFVFMVF